MVSEEERDHDGGGFRSTSWASWAPQLKQVIKAEVEVSLAGAMLESVMKMDASFLEHLEITFPTGEIAKHAWRGRFVVTIGE